MKIYFIVHGNVKTGMGHIIRSISLADAFRAHGHTVSFFSKYKEGIRLLHKAGIDVCKIPSAPYPARQGFFYGDPSELEKDIAVIRGQITERADVIIVDSYNISHGFLSGLREMTDRLVYIDDLNLFHYPIDILVNGTASALDMGYEKKQTAQLLLGLGYNQVRKGFSGTPSKRAANVTDVLITTGNGDPFHMTEKILGIVLSEERFSGLRYHVIVGGGFEKDIWTDSGLRDNGQVLLYDRPSDMCGIMSGCDLAVSAGGSTLYELAACGIPTIAFAYADNQLLHIRALERQGLLRYIGYHDRLDGQKLISHILYLMGHPDIRKKISAEQRALVDGKGCDRIVEMIERFKRKKR